jgi:hypothetical protein
MPGVVEVTGVETVLTRLRQIGAAILPRGGIALEQEADAILEKSQEIVPYDTGSLHDSGKVEQWAIVSPHVVQAAVRYGGRQGYQGRIPEQYALIVHTNARGVTFRGGKQDHYLSTPTFAATQGMLSRIAEQVRNAL